MMPDRTYGWQSDLPAFREATPRVICGSLEEFIPDASPEQIRAWRDSIPLLQREASELLEAHKVAGEYTAILEYKLPLESRRPDMVVLLLGPVVVVELKGRDRAKQSDIDQVVAYVRDLRAYHRDCDGRPVHAVLVPTRMKGPARYQDDVHILGPADLDGLLKSLSNVGPQKTLTAKEFLDENAYRPLPTLIQAARELLNTRSIRQLWRSSSDTDKAVKVLSAIAHSAATTKTKHLVLVTGVPGAGKTLVGLRFVHATYLDDLAVKRSGSKPTSPGLFLSGNGPLVEVLQHLLRGAGGGGKVFVRGVKDYLDAYAPNDARIPPEHVLVFDEAQRAFDAKAVADKHKQWPSHLHLSEPAHFIRIVERIPEWCVLVGLIGEGQEIHVGEEAGIKQWRDAIQSSSHFRSWKVHAPAGLEKHFEESSIHVSWEPHLNLNTEMRFHLARELHDWVVQVLSAKGEGVARQIADRLHKTGFRLLITRQLELAKQYVRDRYEDNEDARYGLLSSSKDKVLETFGVASGWLDTKNVKLGPWYGGEGEHSCRGLTSVVTEFGAQGLELDFVVLCWGTDLRRRDGIWTNDDARGYKKKKDVKDPEQLRKNAYRVLLTRGRDGTIVYLPETSQLDETYQFLVACGCKELKEIV